MDFSNGIIILCLGVFLLLLSSIFLIVFIHGEKKKKNIADEEATVESETNSNGLLNDEKEIAFTETQVLEKDNTETVLMEDGKTEIMKY